MQRMVLDLDKTSYLVSYLKDGNSKTWYYTIKAHSPHLLSDYPAFVAELCHSFADPNISRMALRKIRALRQTGSCAAYAARFHELLPHLDWSETTKLDQFKEGLKDAVLDKVRGVCPKPATFNEYVELAIEFDNELHEDELARKDRSRHDHPQPCPAPRTFPQPRPQPPAPAAPTPSSDIVPMEVDAVRFRGPLTQAEKD